MKTRKAAPDKHGIKSFLLAGVKADLEKRIITGHASIFDNVDLQGEVVRRGAFKDQLDTTGVAGVKTLWQHDRYTPIGVPQVLKEDEVGLYFESRISEIPKGDEVLVLVNDGVVDVMSIGYDVLGWKESSELYDKYGYPVRELTKLQLWDIAPVTYAANPLARINGLKAWSWSVDEKGIWRPDQPDTTEIKTVVPVDVNLKEGRVLSTKNFAALKQASEIIAGVIADAEKAAPKEDDSADEEVEKMLGDLNSEIKRAIQ